MIFLVVTVAAALSRRNGSPSKILLCLCVCVCVSLRVCVCVCVLPIKHSILMQRDYNCKNKPGSWGSQSGLVIRHNNMQRIGDCFWMLGPKCGKADMSCYEQAKLKVSSESLYSRKVVAHHCNKCNIGTVCVNDITSQATLLANTRPVDIVPPLKIIFPSHDWRVRQLKPSWQTQMQETFECVHQLF